MVSHHASSHQATVHRHVATAGITHLLDHPRLTELRAARAQWLRLPWPIRQEVLRRTVAGRAHPDPYVATTAHRWAAAQIAFAVRAQITAIITTAAGIGSIVAAATSTLPASDRITLATLVAAGSLSTGLIALRFIRGQAADLAYANQARTATSTTTPPVEHHGPVEGQPYDPTR
jgi:hypothetical protein